MSTALQEPVSAIADALAQAFGAAHPMIYHARWVGTYWTLPLGSRIGPNRRLVIPDLPKPKDPAFNPEGYTGRSGLSE